MRVHSAGVVLDRTLPAVLVFPSADSSRVLRKGGCCIGSLD
jgi:hypothetical protein